ncbi:MAG TPA: putative sporulation protein YtxC [Lentibacillus sp.]|uniref:putative sporulation protein YtxC n=1 Tax=Lentibacillus sp. TaxID=1925746 RepID=UPI002B4AAE47|nr:putative sporulation protein YtxC [Lentibacillus sp.]HLR63000.1 putative sporulation protein YtxC [Lentibacillus sp.]
MLEVYFESDKEAISFCENLFQLNKKIELHWKTTEEWGNQLQLYYQESGDKFMEAVAGSMVRVLVAHRLTNMINRIIKHNYYYSNSDEIERIMDLSHWIVAGDDEDSQFVRNNKDPSKLLYSLFLVNIKNAEILHFDSLINFQLKVFKDQLIHYVGLAIDEFKREEEHQAFIDTLRNYIVKRKPVFETVHVIQGEPFSYFKPDGKQFSRMEMRVLMQKEPLYIVGLDDEDLNLSPLIAMAPEKIKLFGDDPSDPKTLTVINIFQERVEFEPFSSFPFPNDIKK